MAAPGITITTTGTALDPAAAARVMQRGLRDACGVVAGHGVVVVREHYGVFKQPTGYYESRTVADVGGGLPFKIWDWNVIYGPWLEGTGSRNRTTRFKGYASFRKATQKIQARVPQYTAQVWARVVGQLNGGR